MVLHTLNALPDSAAFRDCLSLLAPGDALLLLGDGVYAAMQGACSSTPLLESGARVYALEEDAAARGVGGRMRGEVTLVDMAGFVSLSERFPRQLAWY